MANPAILTQTGVGRSTIWVPDFMENPFNVGIGCIAIGTVTYNIEHCFEPVDKMVLPALAASTGTKPPFAPGLFYGAGDGPFARMAIGRPVADLTTPAGVAGGTTVAAFDTNGVTLSGAAAGIVAGDLISFLSWFINSGFSGATGSANGNYAFPVRGISINITAGTGTVIAELTQATTPQS